jgi:tetratricopeptide (TPR) repeat protein
VSGEREALLDEIDLRRASIEDARRELADGELTAQQFSELERKELDAIERCETSLSELNLASLGTASSGTPEVRRSARRHRRTLLVVALACFAAAAVVLAINALSPRQPGSSDTGGITTSKAEHIVSLLREAEIDQAVGNNTSAIIAYNDVLALQTNNVEALTQSGWLYFSAGSVAKDLSVIRLGEDRIARAVLNYPRDPDPRLYYAIIAASSPGKKSLAISQFRKFLKLNPSAQELAVAEPYMRRLGVR